MSRAVKPARVQYYIDADLVGLAKILVQVRPDVTYPGDPGGLTRNKRTRPPCTIKEPGTLDEIWIPETARQGWLIITRDRHIQDHRAEIDAVREHAARMVNLAGDDAVNAFAQLEVVMCQWRRIEALLDDQGPFIYLATRTTSGRSRYSRARLSRSSGSIRATDILRRKHHRPPTRLRGLHAPSRTVARRSGPRPVPVGTARSCRSAQR